MDALELLGQDERKDLLRFITAGSVDDGKSTLIGRLLYETKGVYEDQLASVTRASARRGAAKGKLDFSLFTDGLKAEREQNITIEVAYRYFSTPHRKFIVADTPGHEQYTRNMVTGASTANLMVILIDATKGLLDQSRRHAFIASLLGIQHVVVAVNKMDLVGYAKEVFDRIRDEFAQFAAKLQPHDVTFIPLSALRGDNVVARSSRTKWYQGSTLLNHLETVHVASDRNLVDLRLSVQYVCRPDATFRGCMGTVASGVIRSGDQIVVLPSGVATRIRSVLGPDGPVAEAFPPMACCVVLEDEVDVGRGCVLVHPHNRPSQSDVFEAMIVWLGVEPMRTGHDYQVKHLTRSIPGRAEGIRYRIDMTTLRRREASVLVMNEIGRVVMRLSQPIAYDPYSLNRETGAFVLVDRLTNNTVAAGMILSRDPQDSPAVPQPARKWPAAAAGGSVSQEERVRRLGHHPVIICLFGSDSVSTTAVGHALERYLFDTGCHTHVLPEPTAGRTGRASAKGAASWAAMARALTEAGLIVICSTSASDTANVFHNNPSRSRLLSIMVGQSSPGAPPLDLVVAADDLSIASEQIVALLRREGIIAQ